MPPNPPHDEPRIHHRLSGLTPTDAEREFIRAERPWRLIDNRLKLLLFAASG